MQVTVALKKYDGVFEGALIVDRKFTRSATGKSALDVFTKLVGVLLTATDAEEIAFDIGFLSKSEVERLDRKAVRDRETAEINAEAEELERLKAARDRSQRVFDSMTPMMASLMPSVPHVA